MLSDPESRARALERLYRVAKIWASTSLCGETPHFTGCGHEERLEEAIGAVESSLPDPKAPEEGTDPAWQTPRPWAVEPMTPGTVGPMWIRSAYRHHIAENVGPANARLIVDAVNALPDPKAPEEGEKWSRQARGILRYVFDYWTALPIDRQREIKRLMDEYDAALSAPERPAGGGEKGAGTERALKELLRDSDDALSQAHAAIKRAAELLKQTPNYMEDCHDPCCSEITDWLTSAVVTAVGEKT